MTTVVKSFGVYRSRVAAERDLALVQHPTPNQGQAHIADINKRLRELPDASHLSRAISEAQRVLHMWTA